MGPTAAGKTDIAVKLARQFPVEVISVDSALVYRGMDIGTAKPSADVLAEVPHRLIDMLEPQDVYSAGAFCRDAVAAMLEISARGRVPLLVGGTMLYFQALQRGLAALPEADVELRAVLDRRAAKEGWPAMHAELARLDPVTAERLNPTDAQRIQRALEVCLLSGEALSDLQEATSPPLDVDYLNIGLLPGRRKELHARIEARLELMVEQGFVDEVRRLGALPGMNPDLPAMRAVGYRQFWPHVFADRGRSEAMEKAVVATRRLAKRQMTWLRSWPNLNIVDSLGDCACEEVECLVRDWLKTVQVNK